MNKVALTSAIVGWCIVGLGLIFGLITFAETEDLLGTVLYVLGGFAVGMLLVGIAEIINILEKSQSVDQGKSLNQ